MKIGAWHHEQMDTAPTGHRQPCTWLSAGCVEGMKLMKRRRKLGGEDTVTYTQISMAEAKEMQASEKLAALGYTNIIEFGGIIDWTGDVEK